MAGGPVHRKASVYTMEKKPTSIRVPSGIRTYDPNVQAVTDITRFKPRVHFNRHDHNYHIKNKHKVRGKEEGK